MISANALVPSPNRVRPPSSNPARLRKAISAGAAPRNDALGYRNTSDVRCGDEKAPTTAEAASSRDIVGIRNRSGRPLSRRLDASCEPTVRDANLLGQRPMARTLDCQVAEFQFRAAVLNGFTALGIPATDVPGQTCPERRGSPALDRYAQQSPPQWRRT